VNIDHTRTTDASVDENCHTTLHLDRHVCFSRYLVLWSYLSLILNCTPTIIPVNVNVLKKRNVSVRLGFQVQRAMIVAPAKLRRYLR
jgi:hypothetical protein